MTDSKKPTVPAVKAGFPDLEYGMLHNLVGHLLRHAFNKGHSIFSETFEEHGLTSLQFMIMELVRVNPAVSHAEISSAMATAPSVITTTLKPLIEREIIITEVGKSDGRRRCYFLSSNGAKWFEDLSETIQVSEESLTAALTPSEKAGLIAALKKIIGLTL